MEHGRRVGECGPTCGLPVVPAGGACRVHVSTVACFGGGHGGRVPRGSAPRVDPGDQLVEPGLEHPPAVSAFAPSRSAHASKFSVPTAGLPGSHPSYANRSIVVPALSRAYRPTRFPNASYW